MKKLFLYIAIAIILYVSAYEISNYFFRKEIIPNTLEDSVDAIDSFTSKVQVNKAGTDNISNEKNKSSIDNIELSDSKDSVEGKKHCYIVGEKNGHVIVYRDYVGTVFDYTDVKMEVLEKTNNKIYNMIRDMIVFDNKEDLYIFLQTISS